MAAVILAAGGGRRVGGAKALRRVGDQLLVERAVAAVRAVDGAVVVVLGAESARIRAEADLGGAIVVEDPAWAKGVGSSFGRGLAALADLDVEAAVIVAIDQPGATPTAVARVAALPYHCALVGAGYQGRLGYPVLLGRDHWAGAVSLAVGDVGPKAYLTAHISKVQIISCDGVGQDAEAAPVRPAPRWRASQSAPEQVSRAAVEPPEPNGRQGDDRLVG